MVSISKKPSQVCVGPTVGATAMGAQFGYIGQLTVNKVQTSEKQKSLQNKFWVDIPKMVLTNKLLHREVLILVCVFSPNLGGNCKIIFKSSLSRFQMVACKL